MPLSRRQYLVILAVVLLLVGLGLVGRALLPHSELTGDAAYAAAATDNAAVLRREIEAHPTLLKSYDEDGNTLLYVAAASGRAKTVEVLLQQGADPNATNIAGDTPLAAAVRASRGSLPTAKLLIERGASVGSALPDGNNALHLAATRRPSDRQLLLLLGRDRTAAQARNAQGQTPLEVAQRRGATEAVEVLTSR